MLLARRVTSLLALTGLAAGCATQRPATRVPSEPGPSSASVVVTDQELARLLTQGSLMDALQQLRPFWLTSRGTPPLVSVDGSTPSELSLLRLIPVSTVREVRLERSSSSAGRATILPNGDVIVGDVIVVSTRRGGAER